ncbi:LemA family protein [Gordonia soli]|uniref:LemA family protein n=1 Tax=Gordonia soli NBRC 108243 TaxID=1223545 RepID=M0QJH5_9ACTN|nr:LemA family protein [Gordonia soli]GAC67587.1 LemA family protein [Gordonia soli NBRC 108243]
MSPWIVTLIVLAVVVVAVGWYFSAYNGFVRLRNLVAESWQQVDVELQRRHDLVPNLVSTVAQAADFERTTLDAVTDARTHATRARRDVTDVAQVAAAENSLSAALGRLTALAEAYPQLQSIRNYEALQRELTDTEDRIAASRRLYNANVRALNTRIESVPANAIASIHSVARADYFEITGPEVRSVVDVTTLFGRGDTRR